MNATAGMLERSRDDVEQRVEISPGEVAQQPGFRVAFSAASHPPPQRGDAATAAGFDDQPGIEADDMDHLRAESNPGHSERPMLVVAT